MRAICSRKTLLEIKCRTIHLFRKAQCFLFLLKKKKPYHYVVGFSDEILQLNGGWVKHIVDYLFLYSGAPRTVRIRHPVPSCTIWQQLIGKPFTDGLLSKVHCFLVRLMLWLVYVCMPAASAGLAWGNARAYRMHFSLPPTVQYMSSSNRCRHRPSLETDLVFVLLIRACAWNQIAALSTFRKCKRTGWETRG